MMHVRRSDHSDFQSHQQRDQSLLICVVISLLSVQVKGFGDDPLADLRAEVAAVTAKATLTSSVQSKGDGGSQYVALTAKLAGDETTYQLSYKSFLPPNEHRNQSELNDWSGGLGMTMPSDKGWYTNGFVVATLSDNKASASIADFCAEGRLVRDSGKIVASEFIWTLPTGRVTLRFYIAADRPELFLAVTAKPNAANARLGVSFLCYPGGFQSPFDRRVHTSARELVNAGTGLAEVKIDPAKEEWMLLADQYAGVTPRPMGPCAIAADPEGIEVAGARIRGNYGVEPFYAFAAGKTSALFILREFPPTTWQNAMEEIAATTNEALEAGRKALTSLPSTKD